MHLNICFLELSKEFLRDLKTVWISHEKRDIDVRAIGGLLYVFTANVEC